MLNFCLVNVDTDYRQFNKTTHRSDMWLTNTWVFYDWLLQGEEGVSLVGEATFDYLRSSLHLESDCQTLELKYKENKTIADFPIYQTTTTKRPTRCASW